MQVGNLIDLTEHDWPNPHSTDFTERRFLDSALESPDWSHTEFCSEFEKQFSRFVGSKHAMLVPSGTAAVYLALVASGLRSGQEVILPGITWPSVVYAIVKAGGIPKTIDISEKSLCIEPNKIGQAITEKTFGVLATHLFGSQCDMDAINAQARKHDITVIEDAAQSIGSVQNSKHCGTWGKVGAFSLNDRKVLACGEGGCIVTDDDQIYEELKRLQLIQPERESVPFALPGTYKVSEFQAAVALGQLEKLEAKLKLIAKRAQFLENEITALSDGVLAVQERPNSVDVQSFYSFAVNVVRKLDISLFRNELSKKINLKVSAPYKPLSEISDLVPSRNNLRPLVLENLGIQQKNCHTAYGQTCFRLPYHALLEEEDVLASVAGKMVETVAEMAAR